MYVTFSEINILDWYDGTIRAVGKSDLSHYLIVLVKWNPETAEKLYALLDINSKNYNEIQLCFSDYPEKNKEEKWNNFSILFNNLVKDYQGKAYSLNEEPKIEKKLLLIPLNIDEYFQILEDFSFEKIIVK